MTGQLTNTPAGLARSARLLKVLGENAASVWHELDTDDAALLTEAVNAMSESPRAESAAATDYVAQMQNQDEGISIWARLSGLNTLALANLLEAEHPQLIALTLSRIDPEPAAELVRRFPALLATDVLHRMLHMTAPLPGALAAIETSFELRMSLNNLNRDTQTDRTVARIFEALPDDRGETLLTALHTIEPGADDRIKALMFSFADLAELSPAGMQTLLANTERATLTLALKGVNGEVGDAFFRNMTARAREALQEDIAALGAQRRTDVEAARTDLVAQTRHLIESGDIIPVGSITDEDLIA